MGEVLILILNQDLGIEDPEPNFICLNQLRTNGITVNNVTRILPGGDVKNPHSIYIPGEDVAIPLKVKGLMSGFGTRIPKKHEFDSCAHVVLTNDSRWDPSGSDIVHQYKNYENHNHDDIGPRRTRGRCQLFTTHRRAEVLTALSIVLNNIQDGYLLENIEDSVRVQLT